MDAIPAPSAGEVVAPITVTITEQITYIEDQLTHRRQVCFRDVISKATTRAEIIVTLLALLELIKQDRVQVRQKRTFGEIVIERQTPVETQPQTTTADALTTDPAT